MAALSEKVLWPIVGIFIFGILAGFYIDDRRKMLQEDSSTTANQQADQSSSSGEHAGKTAETKQTKNDHAGKEAQVSTSKPSSYKTNSHAATSMTMQEYLAQSTSKRNQELVANAADHQGFSGGIDEYLHGNYPKPKDTSSQNHQASHATSMSLEEYQAKTEGAKHHSNNDAYHGDIDEYLSKYGDGAQTPMNKNSVEPFNKKEHMGFHGSYEDYAKKYN